ncbi:MAG: hypothetical protein IZT59_10785 [Verrucomicrobia bacterium]|nr:hypothetical protein [Verrucomicrobiota bacterium]
MKTIISIAKPLSWSSLALIIVPPILFFTGAISQATMMQLLLAGTFLWFITASLWMKSE